MKIRLRLNTNSINKAIDDLKEYKLSLRRKSEEFVGRLLDEGIKVAYQHVPSEYSGYIEFTKEITGGQQVVGVLTGKDTKPFISTWIVKGGEKSVEVSGILMAEFGSGWLANVMWDVTGVGQGTFPGQTHAFDTQGWFWTDTEGVKHHSRGTNPTYPMYSAEMAMLRNIDSIAREVFGSGI